MPESLPDHSTATRISSDNRQRSDHPSGRAESAGSNARTDHDAPAHDFSPASRRRLFEYELMGLEIDDID